MMTAGPATGRCVMTAEATAKKSTSDRLLDAAEQVFANNGIKGATTREIAATAGVHEVSLFRHFRSKELLFQGVIDRLVARMTAALYGDEQYSWTGDLRQDLTHFAQAYFYTMLEYEPIMRMVIGEARRQPEEACAVWKSVGMPLRQRLVDYFEDLQQREQLRPDVDAYRAMDMFTGALFAAVLRHSVNKEVPYTPVEFLGSVVDIFVRGVELPTPAKS